MVQHVGTAFRRAEDNLRQVRILLAWHDKEFKLGNMREIINCVSEARAQLQKTAETYEGMRDFTSIENMKLIARWSRSCQMRVLEVKQGKLVERYPEDSVSRKILKPVNLLPLDMGIFDLLHTSNT